MKKFIVLFSCLIMALSFSSCESKIEDNPLTGNSFTCDYGLSSSRYYTYYYFGEKIGYKRSKLGDSDYSVDFYYTYDNGTIRMYKDKKKEKLWKSGKYHGSYITINGEDDIYYKD